MGVRPPGVTRVIEYYLKDTVKVQAAVSSVLYNHLRSFESLSLHASFFLYRKEGT